MTIGIQAIQPQSVLVTDHRHTGHTALRVLVTDHRHTGHTVLRDLVGVRGLLQNAVEEKYYRRSPLVLAQLSW